MGKVFIKDIAERLSRKKNITPSEAEKYLNTFFAVVNEGLQTDKLVKIKGLGTFKLIEVRERESVDVNTGERVLILGHSKITFTPESSLKEMVNKPFSQFETVELNDGVDFDNLSFLDSMTASADEQDTKADSNVPTEKLSVATHHDVTDPVVDTASSEDRENEPSAATIPEPEDNTGGSADNHGRQPVETGGVQLSVEETDAVPPCNTEKSMELQNRMSASRETVVPIEKGDDAETVDSETEAREGYDGRVGHGSNEVYADTPEEEMVKQAGNTQCDGETAPCEKDGNPAVAIAGGEPPRRNITRNIFIAVLSLLLVAGVFMVGYYLGGSSDNNIGKEKKVVASVGNKAVPKKRPKAEVVKSLQTDTVEKVAAVEKVQTTDVKPEKREVTTVQPAADDAELKTAALIVKTGAYIIDGTSVQIKVKAGQTMKGLARRYLGEGMECYIQVHNGKSEVKEGETINIPKLRLKKKGKNKKVS